MTTAVTATDLALFCWPLGVDEDDAEETPVVPLPRRGGGARVGERGNGGAHPRSSRVGAGRASGISPG
ncbi:hypothetical protein KCV87_06325 [Actinosynnema pretiosum subsp. pretiosum]|uniref:Uncharacterized protein n=2 Tax=Actinosynnema TaxID=40566 RepID=C6WP04_ACTMD|nr:hypothetical protein [Actinosynnema mirum]ACU36673.1 hypothetical protein Amir_2740 [Actinosynnema mirum DSM 43827]AXX30135.1 hypothetical protein APASM_2770 [Actinosynnema pretiosum subsp. pretiosum]QUF05702.1 hypothetical protein KCV87_06325 [Actinosynnema pretiosum subsp. pretiosum]